MMLDGVHRREAMNETTGDRAPQLTHATEVYPYLAEIEMCCELVCKELIIWFYMTLASRSSFS